MTPPPLISKRVYGDTVMFVGLDDEQTTIFLYGAHDWPSFHLTKDEVSELESRIALCETVLCSGAVYDWTSEYAVLHGDPTGIIDLVDPKAPTTTAGAVAKLSFDVVQSQNLRSILRRSVELATTHIGDL